MTPGQHFIISWVVANSAELDRRSRICITASGLLPDFDGIGLIVDKLSPYFGIHTSFYAQYHHVLGHNLLLGLLVSIGLASLCRQKYCVFALCLLAFHLHIVCDLAGSMGPDGYHWPIYYLYPFVPSYQLIWSGQWPLNSWINSLIGILFFSLAILQARHRRVTFFELISNRLDNIVIAIGTHRGFFKSPNDTQNTGDSPRLQI